MSRSGAACCPVRSSHAVEDTPSGAPVNEALRATLLRALALEVVGKTYGVPAEKGQSPDRFGSNRGVRLELNRRRSCRPPLALVSVPQVGLCRLTIVELGIRFLCASRLSIKWIIANLTNASDDRTLFSRSLLNRRHLPSHANVRSTVHRIGSSTQPTASFGRGTMFSSHAAFVSTHS